MNYTLITGASSGLGLEFANQLASKKRNLVLVARNQSALEILATKLRKQYQIEVVVLPTDLADIHASDDIFQEIMHRKIQIDILINNAGLGDLNLFHDSDYIKIQQMIQVNVYNLTQLCRLFIPQMHSQNYGYILNVASTAAFQPGPNMAVYFATKAYVHSFTQALRFEHKDSKIHISCLYPGPTSTNFGKVAGAQVIGKMSKISPSAQKVVSQALTGLIQNQGIIIPGVFNRLGVCLAKYLPLNWALKVTAKLFNRSVKGK